MRNGIAWLVCVLVFAVGGLATWSLTRGQTPVDLPALPAQPTTAAPASPAPLPPLSAMPPPLVPPAPSKPASDAAAGGFALRDQIENSTGRGAEWLFRMNTVKGRFLPGFLPSLNLVMEGDHFLHQAGAALALARTARHTGDKGYAARATQAVLALLDETSTQDDGGVTLRYTTLPCSAVNRLGAAGLLVAAVNELPAPQEDVLKKSEELCAYLRKQQRPDGSLSWTEGDDKAADPDGVNSHPGAALYGLMRSQLHRPAAWKTDLVRKALAYYAPWWREHRTMTFVPWQTAAYAEAYLLTKEKPFADFVFEMNDWLCDGKRHEGLDARHPEWLGGFMSWSDGKALATAPDVSSASYAEGLAEACRVAREAADLPRHKRYTGALESCLQFVASLQYTDANTQHFAPLYRQRWLVGGFHASHQDGDLRFDYAQHAVCAMIQYLAYVAR